MKKRLLTYTVVAVLVTFLHTTAFAGVWTQDDIGWKWQNDDGSYSQNGWQWIDGNNDGMSECYYFTPDGYMFVNGMTPDGYTVNANGEWVVDNVVQCHHLNAPTNVTETNAAQDTAQKYFVQDVSLKDNSRFMAGYLAAMRYPEGKVEVMEPIDIVSLAFASPRYWSICASNLYNTGEMGAEIIDCGDYYEVKNCFIEYPYLIPREIYDQFETGYEFDLTLEDQNGKEDTIHNVVNYMNGEWVLSDNGDPYDEDARYVEVEDDGTIIMRTFYGDGAWQGAIYHGSLFFTKDCIVHDVYFKETETFEEYVTQNHPYHYQNDGGPWFQGGKHDNSSINFYGKVIFDPNSGMIIECQEIYQP